MGTIVENKIDEGPLVHRKIVGLPSNYADHALSLLQFIHHHFSDRKLTSNKHLPSLGISIPDAHVHGVVNAELALEMRQHVREGHCAG